MSNFIIFIKEMNKGNFTIFMKEIKQKNDDSRLVSCINVTYFFVIFE